LSLGDKFPIARSSIKSSSAARISSKILPVTGAKKPRQSPVELLDGGKHEAGGAMECTAERSKNSRRVNISSKPERKRVGIRKSPSPNYFRRKTARTRAKTSLTENGVTA
jgi:hypothetical protein